MKDIKRKVSDGVFVEAGPDKNGEGWYLVVSCPSWMFPSEARKLARTLLALSKKPKQHTRAAPKLSRGKK